MPPMSNASTTASPNRYLDAKLEGRRAASDGVASSGNPWQPWEIEAVYWAKGHDEWMTPRPASWDQRETLRERESAT